VLNTMSIGLYDVRTNSIGAQIGKTSDLVRHLWRDIHRRWGVEQ